MLNKFGRHLLDLFLWNLFAVGFVGISLDILNSLVGFPHKGVWVHHIFLTKFYAVSLAVLIPASFILTMRDKSRKRERPVF